MGIVQETSLWAYARATQNLGTSQKKVLDALRVFPDATNAELAQRLEWPINRVTPRIKELRSKEFGELVLDNGKRKCRVTGNTAHAWRAKHPVLPPAREEKKVEVDPQALGI
jgi:DNA-binding MarR family transcriptional regulator